MSEQPEERTRSSEKAARANIEQPEPADKEDLTEPVKVSGVKETKGASFV